MDRSAWVCFDASANHGVGWEVPPPTGYDTLAGPDGCSSTPYWPVVVMYVRVPDAEQPTRSTDDQHRVDKAGSTACSWMDAADAFVLQCLTQTIERTAGGDECTFDALFAFMQQQDPRLQDVHRESVEDTLVRLEAANKVMHREGRVHII